MRDSKCVLEKLLVYLFRGPNSAEKFEQIKIRASKKHGAKIIKILQYRTNIAEKFRKVSEKLCVKNLKHSSNAANPSQLFHKRFIALCHQYVILILHGQQRCCVHSESRFHQHCQFRRECSFAIQHLI